MAEHAIISIITTHNNRLQCLLNELKNGILNKNPNTPIIKDDIKGEKIRFFNGCIVKVVIEPTTNGNDDTMTIDLLNTGDYESVKKTSDKYWITSTDADVIINDPDTNDTNTLKGYLNVNNSDIKLQKFEKKFIPSPFDRQNVPMIFYIIRHGQAEHNVKKTLINAKIFKIKSQNIKYDTNLVGDDSDDNSGKTRLIKIGNKLYTEELAGINQHISYGFTSDLTRTQETIELIFQGIANGQNVGANASILKNTSMHILPCSHELTVTNNSSATKCDGHQVKYGMPLAANENKLDHKIGIKKNSIDINCNGENLSLELNTKAYTHFYDGQNRSYGVRNEYNKNRRKCRDTNMLELALDIIKEDDSFSGEINDDRKTLSTDSDLSTEDGFKYNDSDETAESTPFSTPPYGSTPPDNLTPPYSTPPSDFTPYKEETGVESSTAVEPPKKSIVDRIKGLFGRGKTRKHRAGKSGKKSSKAKSTVRTNKHHKKTIRFHLKIGGTKKHIRRKK